MPFESGLGGSVLLYFGFGLPVAFGQRAPSSRKTPTSCYESVGCSAFGQNRSIHGELWSRLQPWYVAYHVAFGSASMYHCWALSYIVFENTC